MKRATRTNGSVNISKFTVDRNELVNNNTFAVANYYLQHFYLDKPHILGALQVN
jgi:hypothetical protein